MTKRRIVTEEQLREGVYVRWGDDGPKAGTVERFYFTDVRRAGEHYDVAEPEAIPAAGLVVNVSKVFTAPP